MYMTDHLTIFDHFNAFISSHVARLFGSTILKQINNSTTEKQVTNLNMQNQILFK